MSDKLKKNFTESDIIGADRQKNLLGDISILQPDPNLLYSMNDLLLLHSYCLCNQNPALALETLEKLQERDKRRKQDGLPEKIKLGKLVRPGKKGSKENVVVIPTTTEEKFLHGSFTPPSMGGDGGVGDGKEGEVIGESPAESQGGGGEGSGGSGSGDHGIGQDAYEIGRILTEKFDLPNLEEKSKKVVSTTTRLDLTDRFHGSGQVLDRKETLRQIVKTNLGLGKIDKDDIDTEGLIVLPRDKVYRVLSKEEEYEPQAMVFFARDYSGSMHGNPTKAVVSLHMLIYCWLAYQYKNQVTIRYILHDTEAKEVPDLHTYYKSVVAGGTKVAPAFGLINKIIKEENLERDYNLYVFYGTDGDDFDDGIETVEELTALSEICSRIGITIARNDWGNSGRETKVEKYLNESGLLDHYFNNLRMEAFPASDFDEEKLIESINWLLEE